MELLLLIWVAPPLYSSPFILTGIEFLLQKMRIDLHLYFWMNEAKEINVKLLEGCHGSYGISPNGKISFIDFLFCTVYYASDLMYKLCHSVIASY